MTEIKIAGDLQHYKNDQMNRVYDTSGISPTALVVSGGGREIKILDNGGTGMKEVKVNDLFCGAGGMGLGFKQAGFSLSGAWDFDKYAVASYSHNVSPKVKQADITQMTYKDMPYADVWTFGFPCQDLSVANLEGTGLMIECFSCGHVWEIIPELYTSENSCPSCKSTRHKAANRSGMLFEVLRLIDETIENDFDSLPNIIMAENVKKLRPYLGVLEGEYKKRGYKMYCVLYNSKFWGVPQNRERYFVVGVHESIDKEFIFPEQQENYVPILSTVLESEVDEKYYISDEKAVKMIEQAKERMEQNNSYREIKSGSVLDTRQHKDGVRVYNDTAPTVTGTCYKEPKLTIDESRVRKLTPREYARLQGFPETFELVVSNSQAYKQFGNAVTVNVARAIAERIKMYLLSL